MGNFSIMWVKVKPMQRSTSMLEYMMVPIKVGVSISNVSAKDTYKETAHLHRIPWITLHSA